MTGGEGCFPEARGQLHVQTHNNSDSRKTKQNKKPVQEPIRQYPSLEKGVGTKSTPS